MKSRIAVVILATAFSCNSKTEKEKTFALQQDSISSIYKAPYAFDAPLIDGIENDAIWKKTSWSMIDQVWLGKPMSEEDFKGKYKVCWNKNKLFVLAEIQDDSLFDQYADGQTLWWDDDCVEVFIDENRSKGDHQYNHNAFAYHIALDYKVVDMGPDKNPHYYNHVTTKRTQNGKVSTWEMAFDLYDASFIDNSDQNKPLKLETGKKIGFAIAYCDNDGSKERENFIGSEFIPGADKNRGWIDAGIFGEMVLVE